MSKNVEHLQHIKSNVVTEGKPKLPTANVLADGELAVNYAEGYETISLRNSNSGITTFSSDDYYTKKKLGSGFTGVNSANTVTSVIEENEATTTALNNVVTAHTANTTVHVTSGEKNTWNNKLSPTDSRESQISLSSVSGTNNSNITLARSGYAVLSGNNGVNISVGNGKEIDLSGKVQVRTSLYVSGIYSNKDVKTAINEIHNTSTANKSNIETLSGDVTTINNNITTINNNIDTINGNIRSVSGDVETLSDSVNYISNSTKFYNFEDAEKYPIGTVFQASTTDKIRISGTDCYAVETPTDAVGIFLQNASDFNINQNELLNQGGGNRWLALNNSTIGNHLRMVANTWQLDQGHTSVVSAVVGLTLLSHNNTNGIETFIYEITDPTVGINFYRYSRIHSITEYNDDTMKFKADGLNILKDEITEDLSEYYKKTETSGATEISNALGAKVNSATFTAHTASTVHMNATEKTNLDSLATNIGAISGITSSKINAWDAASTSAHTHTNKEALDSISGTVGSMAYQNTSAYSSATQVNTALGNKVDKVSGKGLSTNDYTTEEKNKLSGIANGAQVNVIETVKVNGTVLTPSNKGVDVTVPTKTSDLTNNSNFVSDASYVHTDNNYTTTEKTKLSGIASGAEVNQNAFSNVKVGTTTVAADSKTDTLEISGGGIVTVTADATNDKITISATNAVTSVAGKTGAVTLSKGDVGLGNVDNTADSNKTVKAATSAQTADSAKAVALSGVTNADDLKAIEALTGTSGFLKKTAANTWSLDTNSYSLAASAITKGDYNATNKTIDLKNAAGTVVDTIDATAFIKDGMVSNVEVKEIASSGTCLVITFNTDAGKDAINVPISQIFDANNYYTKNELTSSTTTVVVAKASSATTAASANSVALSNVSGADDLKKIEALTGTSGLLKKTAANTWTLDTTDYSNKNAFGKIKVNAESTTIDADTTNDTLTISGASFVTLTSDTTNDKITIGVSTGTSNTTIARGDHNHDSTYQAKGNYLTATTKYAGSSTQGGAATSAEKLTNTTAIGSETNPVFFTASGVPSATTYSLNANVPSNAVFTDTKVTAVGNHYSPTATSTDTKSATASSTSELDWGSAVITGVTLSGDAKGHITSVAVASGKLKTPVTGVTLASGTNNGTLKLTVNGTPSDNIAVKGLGSMAYENTSTYSSATQVNTALAGKSNTGHTHDGTYAKNAFANVAVGTTTVSSDTTGDTLTLSGSNVTLTPDATNDKITIGITSSNVTSALGYTPYNSTNPNGYTSNKGTVTSVSAGGGLSGGTITTSGTISLATTGTAGTYGPTENVTGNNGTTITIPQFKTDEYGRVTSVTARTYTSVDHTYTVNNGTFTISGNGASVASTSANASANTGVNIKSGDNVTITTGASTITIAATDTKYTAATAAPSNVASSSAVGTSTNYARQDHTHGISVATGDSNGQVKIAGQNVSVKGLDTMAYQNTSAYSSATQVNTALAGKSGTGHTHYWANLQVSSAANYITEPEIKSVKINGSTSNAASTNNCHIQYDTTNKCLKFLFN